MPGDWAQIVLPKLKYNAFKHQHKQTKHYTLLTKKGL